jgi:hypothetical protein
MDVRLHERPEAEARSVERWLTRIKSGQLRVPRFQRTLRWQSRHVIEFFDSILRGFPVGELLLSKQQGLAETVTFGPVTIRAEKRSDALFVVDGQQRIVSLAGALLHPDQVPRGDVHAIWFDLEKDKFFRLVKAPEVTWLPLNVVADSSQLLDWLHKWPLQSERKDLVTKAISLGRAIREYEVPAYVVSGATEQTLRTIFSRANTAGVRMLESEVFDALFGRGGSKPLEEICVQLGNEGYGPFEEKWLLSSLKAVAEIDPKRRVAELEQALEKQPEALFNTKEALRRALGFLISDAKIYHGEFLPYALVMTILARFFHLYPNPSQRTRQLLVRWVWRGALSGEHARSNHANIKRLTDGLGTDESDAVQFLLKHVSQTWDRSPAKNRWNPGAAQTRLLALALLSLRPRSPITGEEYLLDDVVSREHPLHAFMNIRHPRRHSGNVADFVLWLDDKKLVNRSSALEYWSGSNLEILSSHCLDEKMLNALTEKDDATFLSLRLLKLESVAQRMFEERTGFYDSDRPSITEISRKARAR